jgi:hypothetical protein
VDDADLVLLATPLYVDGLPYLVTRAMERVAARRTESASDPSVRFAAIVNCGFPEAQHNDVALAILQQFARASELEWAGGLSLGAGGVVHGEPLGETGRTAGIRKSLDQAAAALAAGKPIPQEAVERMAQPVIPARLYTLMGNFGWRRTAWHYGAHSRLGDRPFAQ